MADNDVLRLLLETLLRAGVERSVPAVLDWLTAWFYSRRSLRRPRLAVVTTTAVSAATTVAREACLHALRTAAGRDDPDLTEPLAAAWWTGVRSVHDLARAAGRSIDEVREALTRAGIESGPAANLDQVPRYAPLDAEGVQALAEVVGRIAEPSMLTTEPEPQEMLLWHLHLALLRLGAVLGAGEQDERAVMSQDLTVHVREALARTQKVMAGLYDRAQLAALAVQEDDAAVEIEGRAVVEGARLTVCVPAGYSITATVSRQPYGRPDAGYAVIASHSDLGCR
ncbi:hypothetical protein AB0F92_34115 [Kitasatospora aureofaciens]|uniref:hypothetical protein n=1 Tax=Kitasatospora aureofaciens TaxID=1894 RepID=UPI0033E0CDEF